MILASFVILLLGLALIVLTLSDVFQSVIVPRAVGRIFRPSSYLWRVLWAIWPPLAWRIHPQDESAREDFLATFAPLALILMLAMWATLLVLGFGALFWVLRAEIHPSPRTFWGASYFAGSAFLTIGFGDFVGNTGLTRLVSLCAGASGLGVVSITTAYLFAIFGFFQSRESFIVTIGARAGSPPSGLGLLAIAAYADLRDDFSGIMRDAQAWVAAVMESHLAYPVLAYFRSSHDYESWIGTLGSLMDAATLMMTTLECNAGEARIFYNLGRHATHDLAGYFHAADASSGPGIERIEFDQACDRLQRAGYALKDRELAWMHFSELRATYAGHLNALARHFSIPPVQWVGDRSLISAGHMRELPH